MDNHNKKRGSRQRALLGGTALVLATSSLMPATPLIAAEYAISGASDTIFRMRTTIDKRDLITLTEYLRLSVASTVKDGATASLQIGGWGRADLGDKSRDGYTDGDLQFGYLSFQGAHNNLVINAGRQFVTEGVAAQRLDGLYLRSDFAGGFAAAAFVGAPVVTEPSLKADDFVFGGRVSQGNHKYYSVGLSAVKSLAGGERYREEAGIDLWLHPTSEFDIVGRSSYNSITRGWMEHAYTASFVPSDKLRLYADLSSINYRDYFYQVTTSALIFNPLTNGTDPDEKLLTLGAGVSYQVSGNINIAADYKRYDYDIADSADYYGGKVSYAIPGTFGTGLSINRMAGDSDRLKYTEYRLYATKKLGKADLTLDLIDLNYDSAAGMNGVSNAITVVAAGSYQLRENTRLGASLDYSHNPFFDNEVKGLVKLTYLFDLNRSAEGGTKSEK